MKELVLIDKNELLYLVRFVRRENVGEEYNINIESAMCEIEEMIRSSQEEN